MPSPYRYVQRRFAELEKGARAPGNGSAGFIQKFIILFQIVTLFAKYIQFLPILFDTLPAGCYICQEIYWLTSTFGCCVTKIISLERKRNSDQKRKAETLRSRKTAAVQKTFQCIRCEFRCQKCDSPIDLDKLGETEKDLRVPYRFCTTCTEEYLDFIERLQGRGNTDCYWHNASWLEQWKRWIDYQGAMDSYVKSKEFKRLLKELNHLRSD